MSKRRTILLPIETLLRIFRTYNLLDSLLKLREPEGRVTSRRGSRARTQHADVTPISIHNHSKHKSRLTCRKTDVKRNSIFENLPCRKKYSHRQVES